MTQEHLGKILKVTREMIHQYETEGKVADYPLSRVEKIAHACNKDPAWLAFGLGSDVPQLDPGKIAEVIETILQQLVKNKQPINVKKVSKMAEFVTGS